MAVVTTIRLDVSRLREFEEWADQFPYAISLGMNKTANLAIKQLVKELPETFTIRNSFTKRGIGLGPERPGNNGANKRDLRLFIFGKHEYLEIHRTGGDRPKGDQAIGAIPLAARANKGDELKRRNDWPLNLIKRGLAYRPGIDRRRKILRSKVTKTSKDGKARTRTKTSKTAVPPLADGQIVRASKRHPTAAPGTALWYIQDDSKTQLIKRWDIDGTVKDVFDREFPDQLYLAIQQAIKTARRRRR